MFQAAIDKQARWVAKWLHSRGAFVWLVYGTILWIPLVAAGIDRQGFLYLYIATSLSLITQVPLAMLSAWAAAEAKQAERNQLETMKLLVALANATRRDLDDLEQALNPGCETDS